MIATPWTLVQGLCSILHDKTSSQAVWLFEKSSFFLMFDCALILMKSTNQAEDCRVISFVLFFSLSQVGWTIKNLLLNYMPSVNQTTTFSTQSTSTVFYIFRNVCPSGQGQNWNMKWPKINTPHSILACQIVCCTSIATVMISLFTGNGNFQMGGKKKKESDDRCFLFRWSLYQTGIQLDILRLWVLSLGKTASQIMIWSSVNWIFWKHML